MSADGETSTLPVIPGVSFGLPAPTQRVLPECPADLATGKADVRPSRVLARRFLAWAGLTGPAGE